MPSDTPVPTRPSGARASIDNADVHATIRAPQAQGLRCGLCRCGVAPVRGVPLLGQRDTVHQRAVEKETGRDA